MLPWLLRTRWEVCRSAHALSRRTGWWGVLLLACAVMAVLAGSAIWRANRSLQSLHAQLAAPAVEQVRSSPTSEKDGRTRLAQFDAHLPAHDEIPLVLQDLMNLAEQEGLTMARGEYRSQPDVQGRFTRYRMALPVTGNAQAVHRFMLKALHAQKALALESVQFKRERVEAGQIDARIQWVVLTRLPDDARPTNVSAGIGERP